MNLMYAVLLSCVKATELMDMKEFERLSFINLQLMMHTSMCSGCRDYMKQSKLMNELLNKSRSTSVVVKIPKNWKSQTLKNAPGFNVSS